MEETNRTVDKQLLSDTFLGELKRIIDSTNIKDKLQILLSDVVIGSGPSSQLVSLLKQGWFPEVMLSKLHNHLVGQQVQIEPLDEIIYEMMDKRIAFAAGNMDLYHEIFKGTTDWCYIPKLCINLETSADLDDNNESSYSQEDISIELNYLYSIENTSETMLMALLLGILHELGDADHIKTSPTFSMSTVHDVVMKTKIFSHERRCTVEICFNKKDEERAVLMAGAVAEVVEEAYEYVLTECKVSRSDVKDQYNLEEESNKVVKEFEDERQSF